MYKGINIRQHNKNQLNQAHQFLIKNNPGKIPTITTSRIPIDEQQSEEDSSMWAELERNARIAKQNKMRNQAQSGQANSRQPIIMQTSFHNGMRNQESDYQTNNSSSFQYNYQSQNTQKNAHNKTSKERLSDYMARNAHGFEQQGADDEYQKTSIESAFNSGPQKISVEKKQKVEKKKGKKKQKDKQVKQDHYIFENVIEKRDPRLFTVDQLKVEAPLTKNYRMGNKEEWEKNRGIQDYKLQFVLRKFNKIKDYRNNQKAIIKCSLLGNDVFVCMPTGGGKSLTFQKGVYLCILPLVSLIIDQQDQAKKLSIQAYSLTGSKQIQDNKMIYQKLLHYQSGQDSIVIFCTPQKINKSPQFFGVLQQVYDRKALVKIVIDEVHCVSTWGKQFRQDYQNLSSLKQNFPETPILGLTATVTQIIKQDIIKRLRIQNCFYFQSSFNRPNLHYEVRQKNKEVLNNIIKIVAQHQNSSGIIYCVSRKECEQMCTQLQSKRYKVAFYHANISEQEKRQIQSQWMEDKIQIIIATIAFGMGINKPDVRFVIHHSLSKSLENYYQESGRAGRDGEQAKCILFYRRADKISLQSLIMKNEISNNENKNFCMRQLSNMIKYCEDRYTCRRKFQLDYLGEKDFDPAQCNKTCDNCKRSLNFIQVECIKQAKSLILFMMQVERVKQNINQNQIIGICKGSGEKKFQYKLQQIERSIDLGEIREMLGKWSKVNIDELILQLCSCEVFYQKIITSTFKNNTVSNFYIKVNFAIANKFLNKVQTLPMKRSVGKKNEKNQNPISDFSDLEVDFSELEGEEKIEEDKYSLSNYNFSGNL